METLFRFDHFIPYGIPPLLTMLMCVFLASLTIHSGAQKRDNQLFTLYCILQGFLYLTVTLDTLWNDPVSALNFLATIFAAYVFIVPILVHLIHHVLGIRSKSWLIQLLYGWSAGLAILSPTTYIFTGYRELFWGIQPISGVVYPLFALIGGASVLYCGVLLLNAIRDCTNSKQRTKLRYLFWGVLINALLTVTQTITVFGYDIYPPGNFGFIPLLLMAYGLLQKQLLDTSQSWIFKNNRDRFFTSLARFFVSLGFFIASILCFWVLRDYELSYILDRLWPYAIPSLFTALCGGILSLLALKVGQSQKEALVFSLVCLLYGFYSFDIFLNSLIQDPQLCLAISRTDHLFFIFLAPLQLHLTYLICHKENHKWILGLCYFVTILFLPLTQTDYYLSGVQTFYWGFFAKIGVGFQLFSVWIGLTLIYILFLLYQTYRSVHDNFFRHRIKFFALGSVSTAILNLGNIPVTLGYEYFPSSNWSFLSLGIFAYALFRQNTHEVLQFFRKLLWFLFAGLALLFLAWIVQRLFSIGSSQHSFSLGALSLSFI
ncbi:hypothetical protein WDW89_14475 [Deltaproteobacteria bacterium TL4]